MSHICSHDPIPYQYWDARYIMLNALGLHLLIVALLILPFSRLQLLRPIHFSAQRNAGSNHKIMCIMRARAREREGDEGVYACVCVRAGGRTCENECVGQNIEAQRELGVDYLGDVYAISSRLS